jgi:hypothetical protein
MVEWDFTLPSVTPEMPECEPVLAVPVLDSFRPIPSTGIGEAMVFCIGCGDPMTLSEALAHGCPLPPAGRL